MEEPASVSATGGCVTPRRNKKIPTAGRARTPAAPPVQRAARGFTALVWPAFHPPPPYYAQNAVFRPISAPVDNSKRRKDLFFGIILDVWIGISERT